MTSFLQNRSLHPLSGHYCTASTLVEDCSFTFNETECQADSTDSVCTISISNPQVCDAGYYCTEGIKYPCPEGTFNTKLEFSFSVVVYICLLTFRNPLFTSSILYLFSFLSSVVVIEARLGENMLPVLSAE